MKRSCSLFGLFIFLGANSQSIVEVAGAMNNIMRKGDLAAHVDLDTMLKKNLYALGPVENLKGEIFRQSLEQK